MRPRPVHISDVRAAWWTYRCLRKVRRRLAAGDSDVNMTPPPLPASAVRGVEAFLRRTEASCLEAALVRQGWLRAHGVLCDVVIGVVAPSEGFRAHAWLEKPDESALREPWHELTRLPA